jgi:hypothetical protein
MAGVFDRKPRGYGQLNDAGKAYVDQAWAGNNRAEAQRFVDQENRQRAADAAQAQRQAEPQGPQQGQPGGDGGEQGEGGEPQATDAGEAADAFAATGGSYSGSVQMVVVSSNEDRGDHDVEVNLDNVDEITEVMRTGDLAAARAMWGAFVAEAAGWPQELTVSSSSAPF